MSSPTSLLKIAIVLTGLLFLFGFGLVLNTQAQESPSPTPTITLTSTSELPLADVPQIDESELPVNQPITDYDNLPSPIQIDNGDGSYSFFLSADNTVGYWLDASTLILEADVDNVMYYYFLDVTTMTIKHSIVGNYATYLPDHSQFFIYAYYVADDGTIERHSEVRDINTGEFLYRLALSSEDEVKTLFAINHGSQLVSFLPNMRLIRIWDGLTGDLLEEITVQQPYVPIFSENIWYGDYLVAENTQNVGQTIYIVDWHVEDMEQQIIYEFTPSTNASYTIINDLLYILEANKQLIVVDLTTRQGIMQRNYIYDPLRDNILFWGNFRPRECPVGWRRFSNFVPEYLYSDINDYFELVHFIGDSQNPLEILFSLDAAGTSTWVELAYLPERVIHYIDQRTTIQFDIWQFDTSKSQFEVLDSILLDSRQSGEFYFTAIEQSYIEHYVSINGTRYIIDAKTGETLLTFDNAHRNVVRTVLYSFYSFSPDGLYYAVTMTNDEQDSVMTTTCHPTTLDIRDMSNYEHPLFRLEYDYCEDNQNSAWNPEGEYYVLNMSYGEIRVFSMEAVKAAQQ